MFVMVFRKRKTCPECRCYHPMGWDYGLAKKKRESLYQRSFFFCVLAVVQCDLPPYPPASCTFLATGTVSPQTKSQTNSSAFKLLLVKYLITATTQCYNHSDSVFALFLMVEEAEIQKGQARGRPTDSAIYLTSDLGNSGGSE